MTIRDLFATTFPYLFYGLIAVSVGAFGYIVGLSLRTKRRSSVAQVARLVLTVVALAVVGILSQRMVPDWIAALFGLVAGLGISWWYGRHTVRQASLGVNVALIALVSSLMTMSIVAPDWLDPRAFLIAGSLVGIRLLMAAGRHARLYVPSRRKGDRAIRIATISMLLFATAAVLILALSRAPLDGGF